MPEPELQRYLLVDGEMTRHDEGNFVFQYEADIRITHLRAAVERLQRQLRLAGIALRTDDSDAGKEARKRAYRRVDLALLKKVWTSS